MLIAWSTSEKLRLLILHKEGVKWFVNIILFNISHWYVYICYMLIHVRLIQAGSCGEDERSVQGTSGKLLQWKGIECVCRLLILIISFQAKTIRTFIYSPIHFSRFQNCEAELKRILNEPCPKPIAPNEPSSTSYSRATVIDAWIDDLRGKVGSILS